jgi:hypothetical protein
MPGCADGRCGATVPLQVRLDDSTPAIFEPILLATLQANELVPGVTRWQISLRARDGWGIDLPTTVLRENWSVFVRAARWFAEIPQETFLPCVAWAHLAVELPGAALRAAAWHKLNDLQHAIDEAEARRATLDIGWFERRVENTIAARARDPPCDASAEAQPLRVALHLADENGSALAGMRTSPLESSLTTFCESATAFSCPQTAAEHPY